MSAIQSGGPMQMHWTVYMHFQTNTKKYIFNLIHQQASRGTMNQHHSALSEILGGKMKKIGIFLPGS